MEQNQDYYTTTGKKVRDFCLGFFGIWIIGLVLFSLTYFFFLLTNQEQFAFSIVFFIIPLIALILAITGIIHFNRIGRRYISIGIIISTLIPLLIYGGCWVIISGMNF